MRRNISLKGRNFLSLKDFSFHEIRKILDRAHEIKTSVICRRVAKTCSDKTVVMVFQKPSTRTRVSTERGQYLLGGQSIFLSPDDIHLGTSESVRDTTSVLSRMNDALMARVHNHSTLVEMAKYSQVPVINALSEKYHPLQILADFLTIEERFGKFGNGPRVAICWVGDVNNILHSLIIGCAIMQVHLKCAIPEAYEIDPEVIAFHKKTAYGIALDVYHEPEKAVKEAHVVMTDTFVSMGDEEQKQKKLDTLTPFRVTEELMELADENAIFMHCLPYKGDEVVPEVIYSDKSVVFQEAENRLYTVMAVLELLM